ncbi:methyltransferase FkbM [Candidatus Aerophobetes bacterium]|uniref:Methyltransferase FkbM n=1 Tax=Aerophobetes bacterium TaxID=2030807 RepID=A0A2A4X3V5_UNCAE|nr:MAG: methyltransferase FkbM [Candidatus Aerophobetes bacterium]
MCFKQFVLLASALLLSSPLAVIANSYELERDLVVVDVGCRWGFADKFIHNLNQFQLYGFDPDKEECDRLNQLYNSDRIHIIPLGLADYEGSANLFITRGLGCSSMYEPNPALVEINRAEFDCMEEIDQVEMEVTTLDIWAKRSGIDHVDYIKLDTQGSELLILQGAQELLDSVRIIKTEVEFNPLYLGQPLFADVDAFLRSRGFVLWRFGDLVHYGTEDEHEMELGEVSFYYNSKPETTIMRGGQLYWTDAYYVRKEMATGTDLSKDQLVRDIVLLKHLGFEDLARRLEKKIVKVLN